MNTKTTLAKIEQYFGAIPQQPAPAAVDMSEPPQKEERRLTLEDALARLPRIDMAYKVPPSSSPDNDAIGVLATDPVRRTQLALLRGHRPAEAAVDRRLGLRRRVARARSVPDHRNGAARQDAGGTRSRDRRGDRAAEDRPDRGLGDREGANQRRRAFVSSLGSSLSKAIQLSQDALFYDEPNRINTREERMAKVTAADVQRVARQYLVKTGRTVVLTVPKAAAPKGGL